MCRYFVLLIVLISCSNAAIGPQSDRGPMVIATYNLRFDTPRDAPVNTWPSRYSLIAQVINKYAIDIFGSQEGLLHQLEDLNRVLPGYTYIGTGRNGGTSGEYSAIFYKKSTFELLEKGDFFLSPTPGRPGKGWDAALSRICTWGRFKELASGFTFYFFNAHFDHIGIEARKKSTLLMLDRMKEIAGPAPVIFTGDLNFDQYDSNYPVINTSGIVADAYDLADSISANKSTYNGFDTSKAGDRRIDHIFVSSHFNVNKYIIATDHFNGKLPSDHYPVVITVNKK